MLPPFVVGEDATYKTSGNVWIYEKGASLTVSQTQITNTVIADQNFKLTAQQANGNLMLGESSTLSSKYDTTTNVVGGVTIQGRNSHVFALKPNYTVDTGSTYAMCLRGVHILGNNARVEGEDSWSLNVELIKSYPDGWQNNTTYNTKNDCPYTVGVLIAGYGADIMNRPRGSDGVIIYGGIGCISDHNNYGVIIGGTTVDQRSNPDSGDTPKRTFVAGPGIFIKGVGTKDDGTDVVTPSKIQVSTRSNLPTDFEGFLNLTKHCTIKDAKGNVIVKDGVFMGTI